MFHLLRLEECTGISRCGVLGPGIIIVVVFLFPLGSVSPMLPLSRLFPVGFLVQQGSVEGVGIRATAPSSRSHWFPAGRTGGTIVPILCGFLVQVVWGFIAGFFPRWRMVLRALASVRALRGMRFSLVIPLSPWRCFTGGGSGLGEVCFQVFGQCGGPLGLSVREWLWAWQHTIFLISGALGGYG